MPESGVRVEGIPEAQAAFRWVGKEFAQSQDAAEAAGEALTPYIAQLTRFDTGALAAGWGTERVAEGAAFINTQDYWTYQEFGTSAIEPMHAITRAWERHEEVVLEAYDKTLTKVAKEVGFKK